MGVNFKRNGNWSKKLDLYSNTDNNDFNCKMIYLFRTVGNDKCWWNWHLDVAMDHAAAVTRDDGLDNLETEDLDEFWVSLDYWRV